MKLIYIEWVDAISNADWFLEEEAKEWHEKSDWIVRQCGWLVKEDKLGITIAGRYKKADEYTDFQLGGLQFIPKGWIKKREDIKINSKDV